MERRLRPLNRIKEDLHKVAGELEDDVEECLKCSFCDNDAEEGCQIGQYPACKECSENMQEKEGRIMTIPERLQKIAAEIRKAATGPVKIIRKVAMQPSNCVGCHTPIEDTQIYHIHDDNTSEGPYCQNCSDQIAGHAFNREEEPKEQAKNMAGKVRPVAAIKEDLKRVAKRLQLLGR